MIFHVISKSEASNAKSFRIQLTLALLRLSISWVCLAMPEKIPGADCHPGRVTLFQSIRTAFKSSHLGTLSGLVQTSQQCREICLVCFGLLSGDHMPLKDIGEKSLCVVYTVFLLLNNSTVRSSTVVQERATWN